MLVSMNWINDFVDLSGLNTEDLIRKFTLSTAEVEDIFYKGTDTYGVVVAKVLSVEKHPDSKKLHLLKIDRGDKIVDCVCGAPNVRENMLVAFAKEGASVCGNAIVKATIAGYPSEGMCCSEAELGISDSNDGIIDLTDCGCALGTDIKEIYPIDDIVFEVDNKSLTNRPDLWGHYGIAREFAALSGRELKPLEMHDCKQYSNLPKVDIEIKDTERCRRYSGLKISNVTRRKSPAEIRVRLFYCGMRAINLIADLTNYLMLEMGQPMHAFDMRRVSKVEVARFDKEFEFQTLDGNMRKITPETLMICSNGEPVGVAGVMGGQASKIEDDTTSFLLESANFDGVGIRKTMAAFSLRTDAGARYEKMLDPELTVAAIERLLFLLMRADSGVEVISSLTDCYPTPYEKRTIVFDKKYVDRYTGIEISNEQIEKTLRALGFGVERSGDEFKVSVPTWRATKDVTIAADIIEEITRIYGYDNFNIQTSCAALRPTSRDAREKTEYKAKDILVKKFNLHEVHSYIWCEYDKFKALGLPIEENPKIINSVTADNDVLRKSMSPTLLTILNDNKAFDDEFGIFEAGHVVDGLDAEGRCKEKKMLGIAMMSKTRSEEEMYLHVRNIVATLSEHIFHRGLKFENIEPQQLWQHPRNTARVSCGGTIIGYIAAVHPTVKNHIDRKAAVVCAEINLDMFSATEMQTIRYCEPSKFPGIDFDLTLLTKSNKYAKIDEVINDVGCKNLKAAELVDIYGAGAERSVTIRLKFSSDDKTLTREEVQPVVDCIIANLAENDIRLKI